MNIQSVFRNYSTNNPPPSRTCHARVPLMDDAKLIIARQFPVSDPKQRQAVIDMFEEAESFGTWEPTTSSARISYFLVPKPNESKFRLVLVDVPNNHQCDVPGMSLPSDDDVAVFLSNANMITSIDVASFFTTIRL
ncbi:hypothetical protein GQ42DRAFT_119264, partial [Ramicandelaber brevisporus]